MRKNVFPPSFVYALSLCINFFFQTEFVSMTSEVPSGVASITVNDQGRVSPDNVCGVGYGVYVYTMG